MTIRIRAIPSNMVVFSPTMFVRLRMGAVEAVTTITPSMAPFPAR